ncbi:MAG: YlxR family protein [Chloroflexota bacterium]|nr:YlxR family protein [Chloroflexota bacterium]MDE3193216.1 YlxR family protein [Chloroflexota bacterium]
MACRAGRAKRDLVRVVRAPRTGELSVDPRGKASGRGAYLCRDAACVDRGLREGSLGRALGATIDDTARERLRTEVAGAMRQAT